MTYYFFAPMLSHNSWPSSCCPESRAPCTRPIPAFKKANCVIYLFDKTLHINFEFWKHSANNVWFCEASRMNGLFSFPAICWACKIRMALYIYKYTEYICLTLNIYLAGRNAETHIYPGNELSDPLHRTKTNETEKWIWKQHSTISFQVNWHHSTDHQQHQVTSPLLSLRHLCSWIAKIPVCHNSQIWPKWNDFVCCAHSPVAGPCEQETRTDDLSQGAEQTGRQGAPWEEKETTGRDQNATGRFVSCFDTMW